MKLVFATHNTNKLHEVRLLIPKNITLLSLTDINCTEEIPETGVTIEENAIQKVDFVTKNYGYPCFADDTGLLVDHLEGAPGVHTARYAGPQKNALDNMQKLLLQLERASNRTAHFKTVIALKLASETRLFTGIAAGQITKKQQGNQGFGYDPIFKPNGYNQTFAELPLTEKNKISHRGKAMQQLITFLSTAQTHGQSIDI